MHRAELTAIYEPIVQKMWESLDSSQTYGPPWPVLTFAAAGTFEVSIAI
jgi:hypothetical protein